MKHVQITVEVSDRDECPRGCRGCSPDVVQTTSLYVDEANPNAPAIMASAARLVGEKALYGHYLPTPRREGGRG